MYFCGKADISVAVRLFFALAAAYGKTHCSIISQSVIESMGILTENCRATSVVTNSSAIAKRPRDASCLSVVTLASIVQNVERSLLLNLLAT